MASKMPCIICCSAVQINCKLDKLNVKSKEELENDKIFQWFLAKFKFPCKGRGKKDKSVERFDQITLKVYKCNGGWDGHGGQSSPLPFCAECKVKLVELMETNYELNRRKPPPQLYSEIKRRMKECEDKFVKWGIYDRDKRYHRVRRYIIKVHFIHTKRKTEKLSVDDKLCEDQVVVKEEVPDIPEDWHWGEDGEYEIEANLADNFAEEDPLGPYAGARDYENDDNHHRNCLLCYKAISKEESALAPVLTNDLNEQNFNSMFILRKMLEIPKETVEVYVKNFGCPGKWVEYCKNCLYLVDSALRTEKEITKLEDKLRKCQEKMKTKIKSTYEKNNATLRQARGNRDVKRVTEESREFVASQVIEVAVTKPLVESQPQFWSHFDMIAQSKVHRKKSRPSSLPPPKKPKLTKNEETTPQINKGRDATFAEILKDGSYTCPLCPRIKVPMSLAEYHSHVVFHNQRSLKCSTCNVHWSCEKELENSPFAKELPSNGHLCSEETLVKSPEGKYTPGKIWECGWCPNKFEMERNRDSHEDLEHSGLKSQLEMKYKCLSCNLAYRNFREWFLHRVLEHPEMARTSCLYCDHKAVIRTKEGIEIINVDHMKQHVKSAHSESARWLGRLLLVAPETCDFCGKSLTGDQLKGHIKRKHRLTSGLSTYGCPCCWIRFGSLAELRKHVMLEHKLIEEKVPKKKRKINVVKVICDICGVKATNKWLLKDHKLVKHGIEPEWEEGEEAGSREILRCEKGDECGGFRTLYKWILREHMMKKHGAERKWKCGECGKGFMDSSKFSAHKQIHTNKELKPFQCEICGNKFALKNYLYIHMRLSHQNRPFASTNKKRVKKVGAVPHRGESSLTNSHSNAFGTSSSDFQTNAPVSEVDRVQATVEMETN